MSQQPISCPMKISTCCFFVCCFFFLAKVFLSFVCVCLHLLFFIAAAATHGCMLRKQQTANNNENNNSKTNNPHKSLNCQQLLKRVIMSKSTSTSPSTGASCQLPIGNSQLPIAQKQFLKCRSENFFNCPK